MLHPLETTIPFSVLRSYMSNPAPLDGRDQALYPMAEAALYLGVPAATIRLWVQQKLIRTPLGYQNLSYNNLIEAFILKTIKADGVTGKNLAEAIRVLRRLNADSEHPLFEVQLKTDGSSLFLQEWHGAIVNLSKGGQHTFTKLVRRHLTRVEWDQKNLPVRYFPQIGEAKSKVIVLEPDYGSGRPTVLGRGILASVLHGRYDNGESMEDLAEDFELDLSEVEAAVEYYGQIAA
jgi:uncharacterized protein (DUF433 family)/DNA-binding transcriptional MerR regulator